MSDCWFLLLNRSGREIFPDNSLLNKLKARPKTSGDKKPAIVVVGAGAAGFFAAITAAESNPYASIILVDSGRKVLRKVKISGGGRCNLTHHCFDPGHLSQNYPRGSRELKSAFHEWNPRDTIEWFESHGVFTKVEEDGRVFPTTDNSETIIHCLRMRVSELRVKLLLESKVKNITWKEMEQKWAVSIDGVSEILTDKICLALGSLAQSGLAPVLQELGHSIEHLVPSLFAFNLLPHPFNSLSGISLDEVSVRLLPKGKPRIGPLLITHRGLSGPAILKVSAWEAKTLAALDYKTEIEVNWLPQFSENNLAEAFRDLRMTHGKKRVALNFGLDLPKRLWIALLQKSGINEEICWAQFSRDMEKELVAKLLKCRLAISGKTTNKDEFVTCGGIQRNQIDFRTMESKRTKGLYFAGECIDLDGITGGFNFQSAWTTGRLAGLAMAG